MSDPNQETLDAYNQSVNTWLSQTPRSYLPHHKPLLRFIDAALASIPEGSSILEIGSATPRDAQYMRSKGYRVQCSDAAEGFVANLRAAGEDALTLNLLTSPLPEGYQMIIATAVAPHFTQTQLAGVLKKVHDALPAGGTFAFNVKQGKGDAWVVEKIKQPRFIHFWNLSDLLELIGQSNFDLVFLETHSSGDLPEHSWINVVIRKRG